MLLLLFICCFLQALEDEMDLLGIMVWRSKVWRGLKLRRLLDELSEHSNTSA